MSVTDYHLIKTISENSSSIVSKAINYDGNLVAIKKINKIDEYTLYSELMSMDRLKHKNIVTCETLFDDKEYIYMVFEFVSDFNLTSYNDIYRINLNESKIKFIIKQIADGLDYCHKKMIAHRDLKMENICIIPETLEIKIIDFGLAYIFDDMSERFSPECCGTYEYCAPEVLYTSVGVYKLSPEYNGPLRNLYGETYDTLSADIWSFGVILYILVYDEFPFENPNDKLILRKTNMSGFFGKNLIKRMLTKNPRKRITMKKILRHLWLR